MHIFDLLVEAQNYEQMFNDLLTQRPNDEKLRDQITSNINWARQTLKKNDRIVWFLRWVKVFLSNMAGLAAYNQRYRTNYSENDLQSIQQIRQDLTHFLSLPIQEIRTYVFRNESPAEVRAAFVQFEQAWRQRMEEEKSLIAPEDEDEILLSFPDGYAWWLLPRGACDAEAKAMGHCGNVPSEREGDRILSLRRKVQKGEREFWYPVATFILDGAGMLGEMKGRNNDKPIAKYHPYIIELLRHDLIEGIKGGGYMPSHNFSMNDLDRQTREQMLADKPALASFADFYHSEGMTPRVLSLLASKMSEVGLPDYDNYDAQSKDFIVDSYKDFEGFLRANDDEIVQGLIDLRERAEEAVKNSLPALDANQIYDFLEELPDRAYAALAQAWGVDPTDSNSEKTLVRQIDGNRNGELYQRIENAFHMAFGEDDLVAALDERIREYIDVNWSFECNHVWMVLTDEANIFTSPVEIRIDERNLIDMVDAAGQENEDDEDAWEAQRVARSGQWDNIEWDNLNERREEQGLVKHDRRNGRYDYYDTEFPDPNKFQFSVDDLITKAAEIFASGRATPTINDPRQMTLPGMPPRASQMMESFLEDLRRRAGIVLL